MDFWRLFERRASKQTRQPLLEAAAVMRLLVLLQNSEDVGGCGLGRTRLMLPLLWTIDAFVPLASVPLMLSFHQRNDARNQFHDIYGA